MQSSTYRYQFEKKGQVKGDCPACGHKRVFRYYEGLPREFGKCERLNNCGYHNKPNSDVQQKEIPAPPPPKMVLDICPVQIQNWAEYKTPFHSYCQKLGVPLEHLAYWGIGQKGYFTVFTHRDEKGIAKNAKFIKYTEGGGRDKKFEAFYMKSLKTSEYKVPLFGTQFLAGSKKVVCLVESEKTAVIASWFYPNFDWVACGANTGLSEEKTGVLVGKTVFNLRDADLAGRSTCNQKKREEKGCTNLCKGCDVPHIEKRLQKWKIEHHGIDLFPDRGDGYDLADSIRDGIFPDIESLINGKLEAENAKIAEILAEKTAEKPQRVTDDEDDESGESWDIEEQRSMLRGILPPSLRNDKDVDAVIKYGFYEYQNRYYVQRKEYKFERISNFTMQVKYLIKGVNPKRIISIRNIFGKEAVLDMEIADLISIEKFLTRTQSVGNFLFEGKATDLSRIKSKLFDTEKAATEVNILGNYKDNFYAFGNGVFYNNVFVPIDDEGIITLEPEKDKKEYFYIPVMSSIQADNDEDLRNYRKFIHRDNAISFKDWAALFCSVYGDNGKMAIAFAIVAAFRSIVQDKRKFTPMLFLFGQRGSGKGTMANSLLNLWGVPQDPLMLGGASTVVGFMRKLGQLSDAVVWLDEYKNDIGEKKIESLKNIWDGIGYERGVKDGGSSKTQTSPIRSAAILSGQEMPNVEPALFSRTILLSFKGSNFTDKQIDDFNKLRTIEEQGITNCLLEILKHREVFFTSIEKNFAEIASHLRKSITGEVIERQILNNAVLVAAIKSLEKYLTLPFSHIDLLLIAEKGIEAQKLMMRTANEVQQFFEMIAFLLEKGEIKDENEICFRDEYVYIRIKQIIPYYRQHSRTQGVKALDKGTLESYIEQSAAYDPDRSKLTHRFRHLPNATTARCFFYNKIKEEYGVDLKEAAIKTAVDEPKPTF